MHDLGENLPSLFHVRYSFFAEEKGALQVYVKDFVPLLLSRLK